MLTSPAVVAALALAAATAALAAVVVRGASTLAASARAGWADAALPGAIDRALSVDGASVTGRAAIVAAPLAVAAAGAALIATAVLARGVVVPRRRVRAAPAIAEDASARALDALVGVARLAVLAAVALGFVVDRMPAIAALAGRPARGLAPALADLALVGLAHVAVAALAASALELAVRAARRRAGLRMTEREARDELRETGGEPSQRRRQRDAARGDLRPVVAAAVAVLVGDDDAVAIGWRPGHEPRVLARGRGVVARALRTAARARQVPLVLAPELARALTAPGPVTARDQPALAAVLAALSLGPR